MARRQTELFAGNRETTPGDPGQSRLLTVLHRLEDGGALLILATMTILALAQVVAREALGSGIPGSVVIVQHFTMLISFVGAVLAARSDRLLALSTTRFLPDRWSAPLGIVTAFLAVTMTVALTAASVELVQFDREFGDIAAWGIPIWVFSAVMPIAFGIITLRLIWHAADNAGQRVVVALAVPAVVLLALVSSDNSSLVVWPVGLAILVGTILGMPIFAAIGGAALLFFWADGTPLSAVPGEAYRMSTSPMLPAIPLFTLAGYILAAGGSSQRLLRLFSALVGWLPGGIAVVVTLLLAAFTPLTGASGITILAIGGLLLPLLVDSGYSKRHALGLVTVSGSIGILLPPSLPVILYAYYAELDLDQMFVAGLIPGLILIAGVAIWGGLGGRTARAERQAFSGREVASALWAAKWEVALPFIIVGGIFGGFATLVEASALTVAYAVIVESIVYRELDWRRDLARVAIESATMVGGFMIILSVALGLTNFLIIAQAFDLVLAWVSAVIESPYVFLLALNAFLIVVGALMDIYSAIIVVVPLITPLAAAYGIHPVHLGVIFLVNMELGYLMPPMGENLFLSAYRFDRPLAVVYRAVLPFIGVILAVVLLVTFVPMLSLWLLDVLLGGG